MAEIIVKNKVFPRQKQVEIAPYATEEQRLSTKFHRESAGGYKAPETVATTVYYDKKCPFTGEVNVRGRIFKGQVVKMKAEKTIVVKIDYLHYDSKYKRFARRNSRINVHLSPCFLGLVNLGDTVICGETRPISKTKASAVIGVEKAEDKKTVKVFKKL
jgi:small subunit ribosomal protein S11e